MLGAEHGRTGLESLDDERLVAPRVVTLIIVAAPTRVRRARRPGDRVAEFRVVHSVADHRFGEGDRVGGAVGDRGDAIRVRAAPGEDSGRGGVRRPCGRAHRAEVVVIVARVRRSPGSGSRCARQAVRRTEEHGQIGVHDRRIGGLANRAISDGQIEIGGVIEWRLLRVRKHERLRTPASVGHRSIIRDRERGPQWEGTHGLVVIVQAQTNLLEIVCALDPSRRLARRLHGGQEQGNQDGDDRNHDKELDEREAASTNKSLEIHADVPLTEGESRTNVRKPIKRISLKIHLTSGRGTLTCE